MKKRKLARFGYLLISALFCCTAFAIWLWPDYSPQAACCVSGTILLGYGVIRILGFFSDDPYCPAFHYDLACGLLFMVVGTVIWIKGVQLSISDSGPRLDRSTGQPVQNSDVEGGQRFWPASVAHDSAGGNSYRNHQLSPDTGRLSRPAGHEDINGLHPAAGGHFELVHRELCRQKM